ncbi:ABC transporter permease subunit [Solirubrobacter soli]|uniref:ABC transporter permease subunit n=1 Tax=Solirubrobacter soli TaxID=363832 RepID=UPI0003FEE2A6|nr:ATP-binding cassette domain-containing protein [Solirubrobacter soli]
MTELARDLYLLVAVFGLAPAVRLAGLPVLAASAFAAVGGVGALQLERAGLPIGGAVLLAVVLGAVAGAATGALVARAEPAFVALTTWALAWLAYVVLLGFPSLSGGGEGLTRPALDTVETPLGLTLTLTPRVHVIAAAILCVLAYGASVRFGRSPAGLGALAGRDDAQLARSLGIEARRVEALALAGACAAAAGAGVAVLLGVAAPADVSPLLALQLFAAALAATRNPLLGIAVIVALPHLPDWLTALVLLAAAVARAQRSSPPGVMEPGVAPLPSTRGELKVRDLHVTLGGREILRGLDLDLRAGEIHALIGPNGSGKTTAIGALGVARTFQRDAGFAALTPLQQLSLLDEDRAVTYLKLVGLDDRRDLEPAERRLLAVALAAATGEGVLAFDEPAAGLTNAQRETLTSALRKLADSGRAILVVEHDLRLVSALADVVTVLDEGGAIAHGTPAEVIADATVQRVYLGAAA